MLIPLLFARDTAAYLFVHRICAFVHDKSLKSVYTVPKSPLLGHWEAVAVCVIQLVRAAVDLSAALLGAMDPRHSRNPAAV